VQSFFLGDAGASCFCLAFGPVGESADVHGVVYVLPFAEEANKARRMEALQARAWTRLGATTLIFDLYGTGDSEGDFRDARWDRWADDVRRGVEWLRERGAERVWLWGVRAGALLAARCLAGGAPGVEGLVLWQPVLSGALYLRLFVRLRLAADLQGARRETTKELQARLDVGEVVEVAGYDLHPELAAELAAEVLRSSGPPAGTPVRWFEVGQAEEARFSPASEPVITAWR